MLVAPDTKVSNGVLLEINGLPEKILLSYTRTWSKKRNWDVPYVKTDKTVKLCYRLRCWTVLLWEECQTELLRSPRHDGYGIFCHVWSTAAPASTRKGSGTTIKALWVPLWVAILLQGWRPHIDNGEYGVTNADLPASDKTSWTFFMQYFIHNW